ncbi:uncharacterized protein LOC119685545 [Teleopsis dalmanni]|uniref:uncharacterized protein LOC119685545 n=1 Tax=Teleopsis dalmanni TaxID=139649 RepID=UPI0018CE6FD0|nr:uncharacterized protein LOC119685545 [Teleopsis dalmanni]
MASMKFLLLAAIAVLAISTINAHTTEGTTTKASHVEGLEMQVQVLEKSTKSVDGLYHYICTAGEKKSGHLMCTAKDQMEWRDPHDVEVKLRCPKSGTGLQVEYIQIDTWLTSEYFNCDITAGGIYYGFVELLLRGRNTMSFQYIAEIYSV